MKRARKRKPAVIDANVLLDKSGHTEKQLADIKKKQAVHSIVSVAVSAVGEDAWDEHLTFLRTEEETRKYLEYVRMALYMNEFGKLGCSYCRRRALHSMNRSGKGCILIRPVCDEHAKQTKSLKHVGYAIVSNDADESLGGSDLLAKAAGSRKS